MPPGATHAAQVALAWVAAVAAVGVAAVRLSWVFGATVGLSAGTRGAWLRLGDAVTAAQALAAALGILARGWGRAFRNLVILSIGVSAVRCPL